MYTRCFVSLLLVSCALARTAPATQNNIQEPAEEPRSQESTFFGDLRYVYKVYQECAAKELTPCLKMKLITAMDRAARSFPEFSVLDGVSFVQTGKPTENDVEIKSEADLEANLPRALEERDTALNSLIADKISSFFDTHTLQIKLPTSSDLQRSFTEEGRKKKNRGGMLLLPLILGGTLIPLALGALALLAGKALIVSKLALVLAAIIGLKKLLGGHSSGHDSGHVEVVSGGHGSGWGRSYEKDASHNLAYSAYAQKTR